MASKVHVVYMGGHLGGDKQLIESIKRKENVELVPNSAITSVLCTKSLHQITIKDNSGAERTVNVDGLFIEMGSKINLDFVRHWIKKTLKVKLKF